MDDAPVLDEPGEAIMRHMADLAELCEQLANGTPVDVYNAHHKLKSMVGQLGPMLYAWRRPFNKDCPESSMSACMAALYHNPVMRLAEPADQSGALPLLVANS